MIGNPPYLENNSVVFVYSKWINDILVHIRSMSVKVRTAT